MPKRVGIIQSNYIPWKGYFDFIDSVDEFIILDRIQYSKGDWRNRNIVKTKDGPKWLTIPVALPAGRFPNIDEVRIATGSWAKSHAGTLRHAYARAPHFEAEWAWIEPLYHAAGEIDRLSDVNALFLRAVCSRLEIETVVRSSRDFDLIEGKNERLISLCRQLGATEYLSGPAAREYIDEDGWRAAGIKVLYKSYSGYPEYAQAYGAFTHSVSVLDLLFHTGRRARDYFKSDPDVEG